MHLSSKILVLCCKYWLGWSSLVGFFFKFCLKLGTFCFHSQTTTTCSEAILIQPSCLVLSCIVIADYLRGLVGNGYYQIPETNFQVSIFSQGTRTFNIADKNFLSKTLVHNSLCLIVNNHYLQSYNPNFFMDSKTSHREMHQWTQNSKIWKFIK